MAFLAENPWPVIYACLVAAVVSLILVRLTQQGKFLFVALGALGLAGLLAVVDAVWVTDVERVEEVVQRVAAAAARGDVDAVVTELDPDVSLSQEGGDSGAGGEIARGRAAILAIRATLAATRFDYLNVGNLQASAGSLSRQGKVDFRAYTMGSIQLGTQFNFVTGPEGSDWSVGLRETSPGTWKITRITAVRLPGRASLPVLRGE
jgi:hypothetical protein